MCDCFVLVLLHSGDHPVCTCMIYIIMVQFNCPMTNYAFIQWEDCMCDRFVLVLLHSGDHPVCTCMIYIIMMQFNCPMTNYAFIQWEDCMCDRFVLVLLPHYMDSHTLSSKEFIFKLYIIMSTLSSISFTQAHQSGTQEYICQVLSHFQWNSQMSFAPPTSENDIIISTKSHVYEISQVDIFTMFDCYSLVFQQMAVCNT